MNSYNTPIYPTLIANVPVEFGKLDPLETNFSETEIMHALDTKHRLHEEIAAELAAKEISFVYTGLSFLVLEEDLAKAQKVVDTLSDEEVAA